MCYVSRVDWPPVQYTSLPFCKSAEAQTMQNTTFRDAAGHVTTLPGHPMTALRPLRQKWGPLCLLTILNSAFWMSNCEVLQRTQLASCIKREFDRWKGFHNFVVKSVHDTCWCCMKKLISLQLARTIWLDLLFCVFIDVWNAEEQFGSWNREGLSWQPATVRGLTVA